MKLLKKRWLRNLLLFFPMVFLITLLSFAVVFYSPGDAAKILLKEHLQRTVREEKQSQDYAKKLGINGSFGSLYGNWLGNVLKGDFGCSLSCGKKVLDVFWGKYRITLQMALLSLCFELLLAVPLGLRAGVREGSFSDRLVSFWSLLSCSALNPLLTVEKQLLLPLINKKLYSRKEARERLREIFEALELCPAENILNAHPHQLSGGMLVRVMIAAGIAMQSSLLILDEPTKGLDREKGENLYRILRQLSEAERVQFLLISHQLSDMARIADEVAVLREGRLVAAGPAAEILEKRESAYVRALWKALPQNGMEIDDGKNE